MPSNFLGLYALASIMMKKVSTRRSNRTARQAVLLVLCIGSTAAGCTSSATITLRSTMPIEAEILDSDSTNIYVRPSQFEPPKKIAREDIEDIDHPGNALMGIGVVSGALGSLVLLSARSCVGDLTPCESSITLSGTLIGTALPALGFGLYQWIASSANASHTEPPPTPIKKPKAPEDPLLAHVHLIPSSTTTPAGRFTGISVVGLF